MTTCTRLSDRMPEVACGASWWSAEDARHLETCADCRAEWKIVSATAGLGAALSILADPEATSDRVLQRLARDGARTRARGRIFMAAVLAAAAVVMLMIRTGGGPNGGPRSSASPSVSVRPVPAFVRLAPGVSTAESVGVATRAARGAPAELPLPEIDGLPAEALDSMLGALDEPLARADAYDLPDLGDGGNHALERALAGLEG